MVGLDFAQVYSELAFILLRAETTLSPGGVLARFPSINRQFNKDNCAGLQIIEDY